LRRGSELEQLEDSLRSQFAAAVVVLTDSGTSALALAIVAALKLRPGAAVALPAYSCYDLATAAVAADVPVVLYDVDPTSLGPDWRSLDRALQGGRVGAVVVAHLYGMPVDLTRAAAACASHGAVLIEDAAQGIGGTWNDAPLGSHGPLSVLSFGRGKGVTGGRGGALLARREGVRLLDGVHRALGPGGGAAAALTALTAQWVLARPSLYTWPSSLPFLHLGETVYREPHQPYSLATALAAVVLHSLERAETEAAVRRKRAEMLARAVELAGLGSVQTPPGGAPGFLRYPILLGPAGAAPNRADAQPVVRGRHAALSRLD
jgi:dTDP-4-amino-4,6-dideoxygalactose transaminase